MITFEVAKDKVLRTKAKIDSYYEYPDAFIFTNSKAEGDEQWDNEVVVDRKTGNIISYSEYIMQTEYDQEAELKPV